MGAKQFDRLTKVEEMLDDAVTHVKTVLTQRYDQVLEDLEVVIDENKMLKLENENIKRALVMFGYRYDADSMEIVNDEQLPSASAVFSQAVDKVKTAVWGK